MQFILSLIGYASTATVISLVVGLGYLLQTDRLNDEKMFRIVALVHDIDPDQQSVDATDTPAQTPDEQPSLDELDRMRQLVERDFEVQQTVLEQGADEYKYMSRQLVEARERFDELAREMEDRIQAETDLLNQESVQSVVSTLSSVKAAEGKTLLLEFLKAESSDPEVRQAGRDDVIRLLTAMPPDTAEGILKKFKDPQELELLHGILDEMLDGGQRRRVFDEAMRQLENRRIDS